MTIRNVKEFINENLKLIEWGFYSLVAIDTFFFGRPRDKVYLFLILCYIAIFIFAEFKSKKVYLTGIYFLILSALFTTFGVTVISDKFADYAYFFLVIGIFVDTVELFEQGES